MSHTESDHPTRPSPVWLTARLTLSLVLLSALLVGQWLYATHSHSDDEDFDAGHQCPLCLHGVQFDSSLPAFTADFPKAAPTNCSVRPAAPNTTTRQVRFHDPRAPPRA